MRNNSPQIIKVYHSKENDLFLARGLVAKTFDKLAVSLKALYGSYDIDFICLKDNDAIWWRRLINKQDEMQRKDVDNIPVTW